ncbi:DUF6090 family protein [Croceitalea marina]|uniref:DUF6090 family protein n=1 Tax=Croceitalea marina TaxID=1775166 RepID=A0ABW5MV93_9FLAO
MIKFFRKIRQKLLSENKFSKYLIYAVGEIILVVIGILIALQINNWNESRKLTDTEKQFTLSLNKDLKQDKDYIIKVIEHNIPRTETYEILNNDLLKLYENDRKLCDSLFKEYFISQPTFYPISGSYESAVSGNLITLFKNDEFAQKVVKLYNTTYKRLIVNGAEVDKRWAFLSKKYSYERRTGKFREMKSEQITEFLDDIFHHNKQMIYYLKQLESAMTEIDRIIEEK